MSTWRTFGSSQREGVEDPLERNQKNEQERLRREAEEQRQRAEAEAQKQQQRESRKDTINIPEAINRAGQPITDFFNEAAANLGEALGVRSAEETRQMQREAPQRMQEIQENFEEEAYKGANVVGSEAIRTVIGAPVRLLEGVLDTGTLIKDTISAPFVKDPTTNPFDERYVRTKFELGIQGPKTPIGRAAEGILTFGIAMRQAAVKLPAGLLKLGTGGKGLKGAIASGIIPGAIADILLTNPDDGNLSSRVRDMLPEDSGLRDTFLFALAVDDEDNPWEAKLKATMEGAVTGAVIDTIGWIFAARRAAQRALRAGATKDQAVVQGLEATANAQKGIEANNKANITAERNRWSEAQQTEMNVLLDRERRLSLEEEQLRAAGAKDGDPRLDALRLEQEETARTMAQLDNEIIRGYDPDARDLAPFERSATIETGPVNRAVSQQITAELGPIPGPVRSGNVPPGTRVNSPSIGGSTHILTDAAYRILNLEDGVEQLVRTTSTQADLQAIARSLGLSDAEVVDRASRIVQNVRDATRSWNDDMGSVQDLLRDSGALMEVRGASDGTSGELLTREGVVALKALITDTSNQIFDLAKNSAEMAAQRQVGGNQFDRIVDRLVTMLGLHKQSAVFHAGGLRAFGMDLTAGARGSLDSQDSAQLTMKQVHAWADKIRDLARKGDPSANDEMQAMIDAMLLAGGDPTKTVNFGWQATKLGWKKMMDGMYSALLSAPATQLRNTFGNIYAVLERPTAIALRGIVQGDEQMVRAAVAGYHGLVSNMGDALHVARQSWRLNTSVNASSKFVVQDATYKGELARLMKVAEASGSDSKIRAAGLVQMIANVFDNPFVSAPSRTLTATDDFFKTINARQNIQTQAMYRAVGEATSPNDVDTLYRSYMTEMSKAIDPTTGRILDAKILEDAQRATFQDDPGTFINSVTMMLDSMPGSIGRVLVPFVRTPSRLMAYVGQNTPGLARYLTGYKNAMRSGDAVKIAEYQGREAIGGLIYTMAALGAASGMFTGNGPQDPRERRIWEQTHEPRSFKVGGKWVSYKGIEPMDTILSMVADTIGIAAAGGIDSAEQLAGQIAYAVGAGIVDKSYLAGLSGLAEVLDPRTWNDETVMKGILGVSNNFLPWAGARRALGNAIDPYLKEVNSEVERAKQAALPGAKLLGTTKVDWLTGEEVAASGGGLYNAISPFRIVDKGDDPVKDMLVDIRFEIGDMLKFGPAGVELDADSRATLAKEIHATGVYDKLNRLRKEKWFQKDVKEWNEQGFKWSSEDNRPRHYKAVQRIITSARTTAVNKMMRTDPAFGELVRDARKTSVQYRRGVYQQVDQLTNFPN
jgi:hypothetical protein